MELTLCIILTVLLLPLAGFLLLSFLGKRMPLSVVNTLPVLFMAVSMGCSWWLGLTYFFRENTDILYSTGWLSFSPSLQINMGLEINHLTLLMIVVVSTISFMVHLYSTAYMKGEERLPAYFSYLQLFTFSMLGLVLSTNLFQLYFFWELVGICSFLLIGFYYKHKAATAAAKKAFIVTRFADFAMLIGILVLGSTADSFDFVPLLNRLTDPLFLQNTNPSFLGLSAVSWGALLVFIGGAGKSALFPLHIWLPDAMEGPTPVSALIHAATMVVAGVFLVARMFPLYTVSAPEILSMIACIGAFSYLFAALIACVQEDFKKVLAYSTLSQIAYMFLALGAGGYDASLFHLFTHAFFKAALFLCAGVVIHALGTGKLAALGGLKKEFPITHIVFLIAALSISGIPLFAGFFSKEAILYILYPSHPVLFVSALFTGGLSAFYIFRLYFLVFYHKTGKPAQAHAARHEPWQMTVPLLVLGLFSIVAGYVDFGQTTHVTFAVAPVGIAVLGIGLAAWMYKKKNPVPEKLAACSGGLYTLVCRKFYIDEIYLFFARKVMIGWIGGITLWCERKVIQGMVGGIGKGTEYISEKIKRMQSGRIQSYSLYFLGGIIVIILLLLIPFMR